MRVVLDRAPVHVLRIVGRSLPASVKSGQLFLNGTQSYLDPWSAGVRAGGAATRRCGNFDAFALLYARGALSITEPQT